MTHASTHLSPIQRATLSAVGDLLLPGAAEAGIVAFVERNLARPNPWLFLKYRDLPIEPAVFYREALDAIDRLAMQRAGVSFGALPETEQAAIVDLLIEGNPPGWDGPPAYEVFTVLRMDAIDVLYATPEGYERLGVPMRQHIVADRAW